MSILTLASLLYFIKQVHIWSTSTGHCRGNCLSNEARLLPPWLLLLWFNSQSYKLCAFRKSGKNLICISVPNQRN